MKRLFLIFLFLLIACPAWGATYYVDFTDGNDANNGTSESTPFKYSPGLTGCASVCASTTLGAGDIVKFKRGSTWTGTLTAGQSGLELQPITYTAYGTSHTPPALGGFRATNKNYIVIDKLKINVAGVGLSGSTGSKIKHSTILNSTSDGVSITNSPNTEIDNVDIVGNTNSGIKASGATTTLLIKNSIIAANGVLGPGYGINNASAGSVTYSNSIVIGNNWNTANNLFGTLTDGGGNITTQSPYFVSGINNTAYWVLTNDDHDVAYVQDMASTISPYNGKLTMFVYPSAITTEEQADLSALASAGHEIAIHTWSHTHLTNTTAFTVTSTNTLPTVNVDVANNQIILDCTEAGNKITYSWVGDKSITDLKNIVSGKGWTITNSPYTRDALKLSSLSDSSGVQSLPYTANLDVVAPNYAFWSDEILDTKTWIESVTGISPVTMAYPGGIYNTDIQSWLADKLSAARVTGNSRQGLSSINMYGIRTLALTSLLGDGTEATIRARVNHYYTITKLLGGLLIILSHSAAEMTTQQLGWVADELYKLGNSFVTFRSAIEDLRADHTTADNITFTKTYPDVSDFRLKSSSPAIDAGVDVGLTSDIIGRGITPQPEIGAYEFQKYVPWVK